MAPVSRSRQERKGEPQRRFCHGLVSMESNPRCQLRPKLVCGAELWLQLRQWARAINECKRRSAYCNPIESLGLRGTDLLCPGTSIFTHFIREASTDSWLSVFTSLCNADCILFMIRN
jgi:hypothetical protein